MYTRISSDVRGTGLGVARQEVDCRALCEAKGWEVSAVYADNDVSAYSGKRRASYEAMLVDLEAGRIAGVVAWHPDRLHRSPLELERFIDLIESTKAKVSTVQGGEYDLSTAAGRMTARVVGAVARHESEHKSERLRRKAEELAQAGKVGGGGHRPFGFASDRRTLVPEEAEVIRECAARVLAGERVRGVAADLDRRGVATVRGAGWTPTVLKRLLVSPRTAGLREHRGEVVGDAEWPAIIDRVTHEALRSKLTDPARRMNRGGGRYLLTSYARCGLCAAPLVARPRSDKRRCYVCASGPGFRGCGGIRILAEGPAGLDAAIASDGQMVTGGVEELVVEALMLRLDSGALAARVADVARGTVDEVELAGLERRRDELAVAWADGELDKRSWLRAKARLDERIDAARSELRTMSSAPELAPFAGRRGVLRSAWPDLDIDQRRAVVGAVVGVVSVGPAVRGRNVFDPERVEVTWRT